MQRHFLGICQSGWNCKFLLYIIAVKTATIDNNLTQSKLPNLVDPDSKLKGKITREEVKTRIRENIIRSEQKVKLRASIVE